MIPSSSFLSKRLSPGMAIKITAGYQSFLAGAFSAFSLVAQLVERLTDIRAERFSDEFLRGSRKSVFFQTISTIHSSKKIHIEHELNYLTLRCFLNVS